VTGREVAAARHRDLRWGPSSRRSLTPLEGGVTAVSGVRAAGVAAGLKDSGAPDLALVDVGEPVPVAVTTTTNLVKAAPCVVAEQHAADGRARAVVVNAGNANACTGERGLADARRTCADVAELLGTRVSDVVPLSTGIIGVPMPIQRLRDALPALHADLADDLAAGTRAARAITTTDTADKQVAVEVADDAGRARVGGMAKGAGMIEPAMATMLAVLVTDAPLAPPVLRQVLQQAVARTFNRVSVDACGSTNDTVVLLATGTAASPPNLGAIQTGVEAVCADLARAIVADGEGTSKVCALTVRGAPDEHDAAQLARAVTASALFRAALHGADPNWGRILAAMGAAGVPFDPTRVSVSCGKVMVCRFGMATAFDRGQAAAALSGPEVTVTVDLGAGAHEATMLCADLTPQYVADNAYYTT
jgi:glutamate N-acetyltransferase / amino-acid N-acetyltransferase